MADTSDQPRPQPGILDIAAYVPGKHKVAYDGPVYKLSSNENPHGASEAAKAAYREASENLALYPDGAATPLREAIGARFGLNPERIVCGAGSDELLQLLAAGFLGPGDEAVYSRHGFLVYPIVTKANGAAPVVAEETDLTCDVDAILACVTPRTRMVFLANPNNPTGTYLPFDEVARLHAGLPGDCLLVLDAAYAEYVRRNDYEAGLELVANNDNVVMTRTFSKIYGLAGLRLGWAYCPQAIADVLNRIRGPFNVSAPAIAAGVAAIGDREFVDKAADYNEKWVEKLTHELRGFGLKVTDSVGNFILVGFAPGDAVRAEQALANNGVIVRAMGSYGLPDHLRVSVGTVAGNEKLLDVLRDFVGGGANG